MFPSKSKELWYDTPLTLWAGVKAPDVDPFYVVNRAQLSTLMTAMERGSNVWLTGPAGTGKSTMPQQAAALLGRPIVKIGLTRQTEVDALVGGMALRNNATIWEDGVLMRAVRCPGTIVLLDELTFAPAGVQAIFQDLCSEHRSYTIATTGEVVKCADGVVFVVADNTTGTGNTSGLYEGTNVSNVALVTRFARMLIINYLTPEEEAEALANHTACPLAAAQHLATFVAECRRLPTLAGVVLSMRQMVGFTQMVQDGYSSKDAFVATISSRMPATERATIEAKADLAWGNAFDALIHSKPIPAGATSAYSPSNSPAAKAFGDNQTY
jgi:MoxR-like ATPase